MKSGPLIAAFARREIATEITESRLWWVGPVVSVITLTAFATAMRNAGILTATPDALPYPVFVLIGAVVWTSFLDALHAPVKTLPREAAFFLEITASAEPLLLASLAPVGLRLVARCAVVAIAMAWFGVGPSWTLPLALVPMAFVLLLGFALGLVIAPVSLLFRGLPGVIDSAATVLFLLTPVCFEVTPGAWGALMSVNPVGVFMTGVRGLAVGGPWPGVLVLSVCGFATFALLFAAAALSRLALPLVLENAAV